nr:hypothetical protein [Candidatus Sigynarchaeota archaeon]
MIAIFGTIVSAITIKKINREDKAVASIVRSIKIFFILAGLGLNVVLLVTNNSWYPYGILVPSPFGTYILILGVVILISCIKPNRTTEISAGDVSGQRSWFPRHTHILEGFSKNWITWSVILGIANVSVVPSIVGAMLYGIYIFPHYDMNYNWILVSGAIVFLLIGAIAGGIGILKDRFNKVAIVGFIINITGLLVIISSEILIGYFGQVWLGYIIPPVP